MTLRRSRGDEPRHRTGRGPQLVWDNPRGALLSRPDIVEVAGTCALLDGSSTPAEAMIADLDLIRSALEAAGLEFLLVRRSVTRAVLAVDRARRDDIRAALVAGLGAEPFYAGEVGSGRSGRSLVAEGRFDDRDAAVLRLHRPRVSAGATRLRTAVPVHLEFWSFGPEEIIAPRENSLTRRSLPRQEAVIETVERWGQGWPTLAGMFDVHALDVTFDIDLVFSWVDGSDAEFQRQRAKRMSAYVVGDGDDSEARFRHLDELKYALRSVHANAPWIRTIWIATDSPRPEWLSEHPRVRLVRSEEFFSDQAGLPTHNSHAVESQLHHIDGLAEHFLYSNDDMFFGRPLTPDVFFSPGGVSRFVEATTRIGLGENSVERSGFENGARVNRALLRQRFGRTITRHLEHCAAPLRRSVLDELEREFPDDFRRTARSPFRSATDISVTNSLYHYYALFTGRAVPQTDVSVLYVETTLKSSLRQMRRLARERRVDMFCLNDGSRPEISAERRTAAVTEFLESYFPVPGPWEVPVEASAGMVGLSAVP